MRVLDLCFFIRPLKEVFIDFLRTLSGNRTPRLMFEEAKINFDQPGGIIRGEGGGVQGQGIG